MCSKYSISGILLDSRQNICLCYTSWNQPTTLSKLTLTKPFICFMLITTCNCFYLTEQATITISNKRKPLMCQHNLRWQFYNVYFEAIRRKINAANVYFWETALPNVFSIFKSITCQIVIELYTLSNPPITVITAAHTMVIRISYRLWNIPSRRMCQQLRLLILLLNKTNIRIYHLWSLFKSHILCFYYKRGSVWAYHNMSSYSLACVISFSNHMVIIICIKVDLQ